MNYRELRKKRLREDPSIVEHGSSSTYTNWGCRCEPCSDAHRQRIAAWKERVNYKHR